MMGSEIVHVITRDGVLGSCYEITPGAWKKAIKEFMERINVPLLSKRDDDDHGNSDRAVGVEDCVVEGKGKV